MEDRFEKRTSVCSLWFLAAVISFVSPCRADFRAVKTGDSVVDPEALTIDGGYGQAINGKSFQQDALASQNGFQFVGYYDAKRCVCLARRKLPDGDWRVIRFEDYDFKKNKAQSDERS